MSGDYHLRTSGATYFKEGDFGASAETALKTFPLDLENIDGLLLIGASRYVGGKTIKAEEASRPQ